MSLKIISNQTDLARKPIYGNWSRRGNGLNFGDELAPYLLTTLSRRPVVYASARTPGTEVFLTVGSVLTRAGRDTVVWGSGMLSQDHPPPARGSKILAVRGPLSFEAVTERVGHEEPNVPFGDPALLLGLLFPDKIRPKYKLGVVAHYVDEKAVSRIVSQKRPRGIRQISISTDDVDSFVAAIKSCGVILSSSLHGLIVANALGRPAIWAKFSDRVLGDGFKFRDYGASVGLDLEGPLEIPVEALIDRRFMAEAESIAVGHNIWNRYSPLPLIEACPFIDPEVAKLLEDRWQLFSENQTSLN